jgi:hypothetical protein
MENEKTVRRMKIIRWLLLIPISIIVLLIIMAILGVGGTTGKMSESANKALMIITIIMHSIILIGWAILSYIYAEYVEGEGLKWCVLAILLPYIIPAILFFKTNKALSYTGSINGISIDTLVNEFQDMFTEFSLAETEKTIASGGRPDSELIARASAERAGSFLISKYHLSPVQVSNVIEMYAKKNR